MIDKIDGFKILRLQKIRFPITTLKVTCKLLALGFIWDFESEKEVSNLNENIRLGNKFSVSNLAESIEFNI